MDIPDSHTTSTSILPPPASHAAPISRIIRSDSGAIIPSSDLADSPASSTYPQLSINIRSHFHRQNGYEQINKDHDHDQYHSYQEEGKANTPSSSSSSKFRRSKNMQETEPPNTSPTAANTGSTKIWDLIMLTICFAGTQFAWTVEFAYGSPYLISLGLSKPLMALVWLAGPLSGLIIQPIVGVYSDQCTSPIGRRRPFLIGGATLVVFAIAAIAYAREVANWMYDYSDNTIETDPILYAKVLELTIGICVAAFYVLDFSVNAVQASCRALILDVGAQYALTDPLGQDKANAWAGRMIAAGNVVGYFMGFIDLSRLFPFFGENQLQVLCIIAIAVFGTSILITCLSVEEIPLATVSATSSHETISGKLLEPLIKILRAMQTLPSSIQKLCIVQFWAWLGWFPFLFYITTWVAEIDTVENLLKRSQRHTFPEQDPSTPSPPADVPLEEQPDLIEHGTRAGSFALLMFALVSLVTGVIVPWIAARTKRDEHFTDIDYDDERDELRYYEIGGRSISTPPLSLLQPSGSLLRSRSLPSTTLPTAILPNQFQRGRPYSYSQQQQQQEHEHHPLHPDPFINFMRDITEPYFWHNLYHQFSATFLTLPRLWSFAHFTFWILMISTYWVRSSVFAATVIIALCGVSWGISMWVPFTLIGEYMDAESARESDVIVSVHHGDKFAEGSRETLFYASVDDDEEEARNGEEGVIGEREDEQALYVTDTFPSTQSTTATTTSSSLDTGTVLGIHNLYVVFPQFIATFISSFIFAYFNHQALPPDEKHPDKVDLINRQLDVQAFGWVLRVGGMAALMAFVLSLSIKEAKKCIH